MKEPGEIEAELLRVCGELDTRRKCALLTRAYELLGEKLLEDRVRELRRRDMVQKQQ